MRRWCAVDSSLTQIVHAQEATEARISPHHPHHLGEAGDIEPEQRLVALTPRRIRPQIAIQGLSGRIAKRHPPYLPILTAHGERLRCNGPIGEGAYLARA